MSSPKLTTAYTLGPDGSVCHLGASLVGNSVSLAGCLRERMEVGFPEEPLTDNECPWQGDESRPPSPSRNTPAAAPRPQLSRREKKKAHDNEQRRTKRAAAGGPGCNGAKKVAKKRRLEATKDLLRVDLDLAGHT